jgi:hypothetical protein
MHVDKVQRVVTCLGRLQLAATLGAGVTKLHLALEQLCAGAADPGHHWLLYPPLLQGGNLDHAEIVPHHAFGALIRRQHRCAVSADHRHDSAHQRVLILSSKLSQHHDQLDLWDVLVAQAVVRQRGSREDITADGDPCAAEKDSTQVYLHELHQKEMLVDKAASRSYVQTFIEPICCAGQDVVHLIGHAAGFGDKAHRSRPVQLACDNVV